MELKKRHTEEFTEIANRIPDNYTSFIVYSLFVLLVLFVIFSVIIKIPETMTAEVRVTSVQPPTVIKAQTNGRITILIKEFPKKCCKNDYLAIIENPADHNHVKKLNQILDSIDIYKDIINENGIINLQLYLGEIDPSFNAFKIALQKYALLIGDTNEHKQDIRMLEQDACRNLRYIQNKLKVLDIQTKQRDIKRKEYKTDSILYSKNALLLSDLNNSYANLLNVEIFVEETNTEIENANQAIFQARLKIERINFEYANLLTESKLQIFNSYMTLRSKIMEWENKYVFLSPDDGIVELANILSNYSFVASGEPIFNIIHKENRYYGIAVLPADGAGNVTVGQNVNLKIDLYPNQDNGVLEGVVSSISLNTMDRNYLIYITLPNGLRSSVGEVFSFAETMYGNAEIITKKKPLISIIFNKISTLFDSSKRKEENNVNKDKENQEDKTNTLQF